MGAELAPILEALAAAPKYRHVAPGTLARVAKWSMARSRTTKDATKRAKRHLHQVYGAFLGRKDVARAHAALEEVDPDDEGALREACRGVLGLHPSTRERLPLLEEIYGAIFEITGTPRRVLDCAAGLHPFALPWMALPPEAHYVATDIDTRLANLLGLLDARVPQHVEYRCLDLVEDGIDGDVDVALLFKVSTSLERQVAGSTRRLLGDLPARHVVLSFPTASLGGHPKGMAGNYERFMDGVLEELGLEAARIRRPEELFFVVTTP